MEYLKKHDKYFDHLLSIPFIYMIIFPLIILDIFSEIYHRVCFYLWGLPYIPREDYIKIDRHKLEYLSMAQKLNCVYCGYANGVLQYTSAIAAQTEKYWCGIQHAQAKNFKSPKHHKNFVKYNDKKSLDKKYRG